MCCCHAAVRGLERCAAAMLLCFSLHSPRVVLLDYTRENIGDALALLGARLEEVRAVLCSQGFDLLRAHRA